MKVIGITGGIGAGKTELLKYIEKHYSCVIYLADQVAHEVQRPGTECYEELIKLLGTDILCEDGSIDKKKMAAKIFAMEGLRQEVNALVHPRVREYLTDRMEQARKEGKYQLFFVEAALLIECGYGALVDEMWYIYADPETRRERLGANRGYTREKSDSIMEKQLSHERFLEGADFCIDNSGELEESYKQIDKKLEGYSWIS